MVGRRSYFAAEKYATIFNFIFWLVCLQSTFRAESHFLLFLADTASAVRPVTAEQLEEILAATHNASDAQVAAQLSNLKLMERR